MHDLSRRQAAAVAEFRSAGRHPQHRLTDLSGPDRGVDRDVKGRDVKSIGMLTAMMLPDSMWVLATWTLFLLGYALLGLPLGIDAHYNYPS